MGVRERFHKLTSRRPTAGGPPAPAGAQPSPSVWSPSARWMVVIISLECALAVSSLWPEIFGHDLWAAFPGPALIPALWYMVAALVAPAALAVACYVVRQQNRERAGALQTSHLMDTVLHTSREWLWAIGPDGRFTFSGPACRDIVGYEPAELLGQPFTMVMDPAYLAEARRARREKERGDESWSGLVAACRHRDGRSVLVEVSGRPLLDDAGCNRGFEGTSRALDAGAAHALAVEDVRARINGILCGNNLVTAFQPIRSLATGAVIGAEALTRFVSPLGLSPEAWFTDAASVGLGAELELLAARNALAAARSLPPELYVAINLSPPACLAPGLAEVLSSTEVVRRRILLEVTERVAVSDYAPLAAVLTPLRRSGLRIAVDDAGAGFASMHHILQLKPDVIKLDRKIIAGIDGDGGQRALGAAMVGFAREIGAAVVAEGIETERELAAVTRLGMDAGQGYLLGRPAVRPEDWATWSLQDAHSLPTSDDFSSGTD